MRETQVIRNRVRGEESGARPTHSGAGLKTDGIVPWCRRHLAVRESPSGRRVGVTRLLSDRDAHRLREIYSMDACDLGPQEPLESGADA